MDLQQLVNVLTHKSRHTLDVVITRNSDSSVVDIQVNDPLISDHKAISLRLSTQRPSLPQKVITYRALKKIDVESFRRDINACTQLHPSTMSDSVDDALQEYNNALVDIVDRHAPMKTRKVSVRPIVPWYNEAVAAARSKKQQCEKKMESHQSRDS